MMRKILGGFSVLATGAVAFAFATGAFSVGCGSSSTGGTTGGSGTTSGGSTGGSTGGTGDAGNTQVIYCDGFGLKDGSGNQFLVETYDFSSALKAGGCYNTMVGYQKDAGGFIGYVDGNSVPAAGGILDVDQEFGGEVEGTGTGSPTAAADPVLFPAGCDDMGLGTGLDVIDGLDAGMNFTAPTGGLSVASVVTAKTLSKTAVVFGVVTAIYPWKVASGSTAAASGSFYIQDVVAAGGTPAPGSGSLVYLNKDDIGTNVAPNRGDVVTITGFDWDPYNGADHSEQLPGYTNNQNQMSSNTGAVVAVIGTAPLPPPVSLTAADLAPTGTSESAYYQMRVSVSGGPFTVDGTGAADFTSSAWDCPAPIETVSSGSN